MRNFNRVKFNGFKTRNRRPFGKYRPNRFKKARLNPLMFVKKSINKSCTAYIPVNKFSDFALNETVKKNIALIGFKKPTAIQDQAIIPILEGKDLVGIANTGTGKTAAFLLPLITKASKNPNQKVLIITPTRELAVQIQEELKKFSAGMRIFSTLCIGGTPIRIQIRGLSRRPNFVIGTPGRIRDLEKRRALYINTYKNVVLDEVDRMLDMGFIHDIRAIISLLPKERQSLFFSATLPQETKSIMQKFLINPVMVTIKSETSINVDQDIVKVQGKDKIEVLYHLLIKDEFKKVLVFGRTKLGINKLEVRLRAKGLRIISIHGNKTQGQRLKALKMMKNNQVQVMLATDVAARGIDIQNITHVINYDQPETYNDYIHRIGRTGRAGKRGVALTFVER